MAGLEKRDLTCEDVVGMRDRLLAFATEEGEDLDAWRCFCTDPHCPMTDVVRAKTDAERRILIDAFPDDQIFDLMVKHLACYESRIR
jgi:hypothetical protein